MTTRRRHTMAARRFGVVGLAVVMLGATLWTEAASADDYDTIDAGANAAAAAKAINDSCADIEECYWRNGADGITLQYGPEKVVGDVLYNCSKGDEHPEARTAVGVEDSRGETTSLSEDISLEASLGFLGLAKSSAAFDVYSKQGGTFATAIKNTQYTSVAPGYKGWTQAAALSLALTGSVVSDIHLIKVTGIQMLFPYAPGAYADHPAAVYSGYSTPMTADDIAAHCVTSLPGARDPNAEVAQLTPRAVVAHREHFMITICRHTGTVKTGSRECVRRRVVGRQAPPERDKVTATLTQAGRVYAEERNRRGPVKLTQRRTLKEGHYTLTLREKPRRIIVRDNGHKLYRARQEQYVVVPFDIHWTRKL